MKILIKRKLIGLAIVFIKLDYDIGKLMEDIFTSDWFYDEKNIGVRIKSPIELFAGIQRMFPMTLQNEDASTFVSKSFGSSIIFIHPMLQAGRVAKHGSIVPP